MVYIHRSFMTLGLETSSSHWDTTPVVVGAVVEGESLGPAWRDLGGIGRGYGPWRLGSIERGGAHQPTLRF